MHSLYSRECKLHSSSLYQPSWMRLPFSNNQAQALFSLLCFFKSVNHRFIFTVPNWKSFLRRKNNKTTLQTRTTIKKKKDNQGFLISCIDSKESMQKEREISEIKRRVLPPDQSMRSNSRKGFDWPTQYLNVSSAISRAHSHSAVILNMVSKLAKPNRCCACPTDRLNTAKGGTLQTACNVESQIRDDNNLICCSWPFRVFCPHSKKKKNILLH